MQKTQACKGRAERQSDTLRLESKPEEVPISPSGGWVGALSADCLFVYFLVYVYVFVCWLFLVCGLGCLLVLTF